MTLRVAIIGAGRMGRIRALSARAHPQCEVVHVSDPAGDLARTLAVELACSWSANWRDSVQRSDVDAVVVATPHKFLASITAAAVRNGKSVLCEKPMARTSAEGEEIVDALDRTTGTSQAPHVVVGYTLRHHAAIASAKELVNSGVIGDPFYVRGRYGHGGRSGYEREWRGNRELAGGGELLDQGVHLIDLSRWVLGEFCQVVGFVNSYFWRPGQSPCSDASAEYSALPATGREDVVEDNAFILLRTAQKKTAMLHVSWTQWKNLFSFEIFGPKGSVSVDGLGGSYGEERLTIARRLNNDGAPEIEVIRFNQATAPGIARQTNPDAQIATEVGPVTTLSASCWDQEWTDFVRHVRKDHSTRAATAADGYQNLRIVDALYDSAARNTPVNLRPHSGRFLGEGGNLEVSSSDTTTEVLGNL